MKFTYDFAEINGEVPMIVFLESLPLKERAKLETVPGSDTAHWQWKNNDRKKNSSMPHGVKYIIDGLLQTQAGGSIKMRTVWIIDKGHERARFVTAYPV